MKKNESKWGMVIQYLENDEYLNLSSRQTEDLLELRSLKVYVDKLNQSIDRDSKIVQRLQKNIKERKEKIRNHKLKGKPLFERLEHLKNEHQIVVYYTEGVHKRKKIDVGEERLIKDKKTVEVEYKQINLKYRSIHLTSSKSVYLKPRRNEILDDLKLICPNWYESVGKSLRVDGKDSKIQRARDEFVNLFSPVLRELITIHSKEIIQSKFSITYKVLLEKLKEKGL
jgi:hypothetical protein